MEPRFTRGEYWLLETVVEHEWDISSLIDDSELELHLNKKGHGLTRDALVETLYRLLSSGLIYAETRLPFSDEVIDFISTAEQIELALDESKARGGVPEDKQKITYYGLTQEGGAQWEAFAAPNWQRYIIAGFGFLDDTEDIIWEMICADKDWLEKYFESQRYYNPETIVLESVARDYIAPWEATYWKQLEGAHRIRFREPDESEKGHLRLPIPSFPDMGFFNSVWCAWR
ncbi:hypothetical protein C6503_06820 [Candidatus Poribacteria bacterium]|nr:MAG: hypothetical protein C6503_06820 [Candidatus Poribacteria bacterium]